MSQELELQLEAPAVEFGGRTEAEETSQNLLADSQTMMESGKKSNSSTTPGAVDLTASSDNVAGAQNFCLDLNAEAQAPGRVETTGEIDLTADIKAPAEVEASLSKIEGGLAAKPAASEVEASAGISRDIAAVVVGGPSTWIAYRMNKEALDPIIDTTAKVSFAVNTGTLPKLVENAVNQPITTALEFLTCPALPILHASVSATNDALK